MIVSDNDKKILRELAKKQIMYAKSEKNEKTKKEWYRHHHFEKGRPMIHLELGTFANEVLEPRLKCETDLGRQIERVIYDSFLNYELFGDDRPVPEYIPIKWQTYFHLFDQKIGRICADDSSGRQVGHKFQHVIYDLEEDYHKLKPSTYGVDKQATLEYRDTIEDIVGNILPAKMTMDCLSACPTQELVHMMGMETMLISMFDYPELFKKLMNRIANDYIEYFKWLEKEELLLPTNSDEHLGQGSWCFTDELPGLGDLKGCSLKTQDVWGYMDSQETVGISPDMFNEFIFPCYERISKVFGLLSYGCCEPVNSFWEGSLSKLNNMRKISISPWCDEGYMGDMLRGKKIIYHRKPTPYIIGVPEVLDENELRNHIRSTLKAAKGCQLEITQRDVYTIHGNEEKAKRYIDIIRDEIERNWE